MATLVFKTGAYQLGGTMTNFIADTTNGIVTLILPTIGNIANSKILSGLNVAGTFSFAFEKIGNNQLIFQAGRQDETINGNFNITINDNGSGIIFVTSDLGWGITNFSKNVTTNNVEQVIFTKAQFDASSIGAPIMVVAPIVNTLIVPKTIIISITDADTGGGSVGLTFGYIGHPIADIDLSGTLNGATIITPAIVSQLNYIAANTPFGLGIGFWKKAGSVGGKFNFIHTNATF